MNMYETMTPHPTPLDAFSRDTVSAFVSPRWPSPRAEIVFSLPRACLLCDGPVVPRTCFAYYCCPPSCYPFSFCHSACGPYVWCPSYCYPSDLGPSLVLFLLSWPRDAARVVESCVRGISFIDLVVSRVPEWPSSRAGMPWGE